MSAIGRMLASTGSDHDFIIVIADGQFLYSRYDQSMDIYINVQRSNDVFNAWTSMSSYVEIK